MKRSRPKIKAEILQICQGDEGANVTKIVYGANLNFRTVRPYLDELVNEGFLSQSSPFTRPLRRGNFWFTTQRGITAAGLLRASELV